ncbi:MAG: sel1 repeat family protein [Legionella sp.]|nr:sel1 repeat family protein [Legionella sp.]
MKRNNAYVILPIERARIAYEQVLVFDNTLADAHYRLGSFHHQGAGTAINLEKARCFYEKALSLGKSEALLALGAIQEKASPYCYAEQAFATYLHAARYPNLRIKACEALERILLTYPRPTGEEAYQLSKHFLDQQDIEKAVFWYIKGENQPTAHATHPLKTQCLNTPNFCFSLGQAYEVQDNLGAASSAYAKARHCAASFNRLQTMADDGLAVAQYALGHDYYHHQRNNRNAIDYCLKAAAQHYVPALDYLNQTSLSAESYYTIASAYETGNIVKKDITQALSFYKKARNQGHREALFALGRCYEDPSNHPVTNLKKALHYYVKAANAGVANASRYVERLQRQITVDISYARPGHSLTSRSFLRERLFPTPQEKIKRSTDSLAVYTKPAYR